ncbi:MAG: AbrB/MazE/SpoVT family DNA-binding domain-containing protein [Acidobacteria bacterium]|nr:AbrB/MazE/SpoVT family DNA-binding domain-containing protein [Acidobacteriota bacterium]
MAHTMPFSPPNQYGLQLGVRGRIVLPAAVREQLELKPGDRMVLTVDPDSGEMRLSSVRAAVHRFCGVLKDISPERILSEELIAERRQEAMREDQE